MQHRPFVQKGSAPWQGFFWFANREVPIPTGVLGVGCIHRASSCFCLTTFLLRMIQRIQSVYLLLGALALMSLFAFNRLWEAASTAAYGWIEPALIGLISASAALALGSIFLYNNRSNQRTAVIVTQGLTALLTSALYGWLFLEGDLSVQGPEGILLSKAAVLVLPVVSYVLFILARRGIEHDIKLVEDSNRMRLRDR